MVSYIRRFGSPSDMSSHIIDTLKPKWYSLKSRRKGNKSSQVSGEVQMQFSLYDSANPAASPEEIYQKFKSTILAAEDDPDDGLFENTSHEDNEYAITRLEDEESVDDLGKGEETSDETEDQSKPGSSEKSKKRKKLKMLRRKSRAIRAYQFTGKNSDVSGIIFLEIGKITDLPPEKNSKIAHSSCLVVSLLTMHQ